MTTNDNLVQQVNVRQGNCDGDSPEILYRQELIVPSQSWEEAGMHIPQEGDPREHQT